MRVVRLGDGGMYKGGACMRVVGVMVVCIKAAYKGCIYLWMACIWVLLG